MQYKNYITEFSSRAKKVLEKFSKCDPNNKLNVTVLLSVATSAFVIPFERLKEEHPFGDRNKFEKIASQVDMELKKSISESELINDLSLWTTKDLSKSLEEVDFENGFGAITNEYKIESLINTIRNALAHGNIYSYSKSDPVGHIDTLYFVTKKSNEKNAFFDVFEICKSLDLDSLSNSKKKEVYNNFIKSRNTSTGYCVVKCSLSEFHIFLNNWVNLLSPPAKISQRNCK